MPLVPAICTQCQGTLEVNPEEKTARCPHCGAVLFMENPITNNNTTNIYEIGKLEAGEVTITDNKSKEEQIKSAETLIKLGKYSDACSKYETLAKDFAQDYRVWWGLLKAQSENFTKTDISQRELTSLEKLYQDVCTVAAAEEKSSLEAQYNAYHDRVKSIIEQEKEKLEQEKEKLEQEKEKLEHDAAEKKSNIQSQIDNLTKKQKRNEKIARIIDIALCIGGLIYALSSFTLERGIIYKIFNFILLCFLASIIAGILLAIFHAILSLIDKSIEKQNRQLQAQFETIEDEYGPKISSIERKLRELETGYPW